MNGYLVPKTFLGKSLLNVCLALFVGLMFALMANVITSIPAKHTPMFKASDWEMR